MTEKMDMSELSVDTAKTLKRFGSGYSCSEAVATVYGPRFGVDEDSLRRAACGFSGGIGGRGETCGALSGAIMVLGLAFAPKQIDDRDAKQALWARIRSFLEAFEAGHGSTLCKDLLGHDISSEQGVVAAREAGAFEAVCPALVAEVCTWLETCLQEAGQE